MQVTLNDTDMAELAAILLDCRHKEAVVITQFVQHKIERDAEKVVPTEAPKLKAD